MRIALAQINSMIGDFKNNVETIKAFTEKAEGLGCDLIIFPELAVSGYPPQDLLEQTDFVQANLVYLGELVRSVRKIAVICGFVDRNPNPQGNLLYNSAVLFEEGKILHQAHKRLLPTYDVFDERRYFEPGLACSSFPYKGERIGLTICEDIWNDKGFFLRRLYPIDPVELLAQSGATLIINISASPYYLGKRELKWKMLSNIARKYRIPIIYVNQVGGNDSLLFDGLSVAFDNTGKMTACARDFEEDLIVFDSETQKGDLHPISQSAPESVLKALVMGVRDYASKCGFKQAVLGLSGGIDSSLTAYLAAEALRPANVLGVAMPSPYSSKESLEDAKRLAENLNIKFAVIPISEIFQSYLQQLSSTFVGTQEDVTEQNIQARIRGNILMALSNKFGYLVLSTGNKSELAVGYCTLYGDLTGGLAVISDVPKIMVYELARYVNQEDEIIPERVLKKPPSAELKPGQVDQDDLPPYDVLDIILKEYLENNKGWKEIAGMGFDPALVKDIISRVNRNEYKRHQSPPGLKVTARAFGYGRRYPLAHKYGLSKK